jgi:hypothetical protein
MIGALIFHLKARDTFKGSVGAVVLLVLAAVVLIFQFATA